MPYFFNDLQAADKLDKATDNFYKQRRGDNMTLDYTELNAGVKESTSSCKCACKHESHIVSLAQEISQLKQELSDLSNAAQAQAFAVDEQIESINDDIAMLDERTQVAGNSEPKPVRKVVYEYERYYD